MVSKPHTEAIPRNRNDPLYHEQLEEKCGDLGVMEVDEDQVESEVRHCLNHPSRGLPDFDAIAARRGEERMFGDAVPRVRRGRFSTNRPAPTNVFGRDSLASCWYSSERFGCSKGCRWTVCG